MISNAARQSFVALELVQERAKKHAYDIDAIDWAQGLSAGIAHFPVSQMPLAFTPGWALLTDEEKLQANQWYALAVSEQFIFLERDFLVPAVLSLLHTRKKTLPQVMKDALETFVVEEEKHGEMFRRLLRTAHPEWYADSDAHFYTPGRLSLFFSDLAVRRSDWFCAWPWLGLILEEKTIAYYRAYENAAREAPIDPLHRSVHRYHFLDEARHVQIEQHLIALVYDDASEWLKSMNRKVLCSTLRKYTTPRRRSVSANIVRALVEKFPRLKPHEETLLSGVFALASDPRFQRQVYGEESIPKAFRMFDMYPEMVDVAAVAPDYRAHREAA